MGDHIGHHGYLNTVTMSPDGSLCASGGKDAKAMLWDLNDGKHLYTLDNNDIINSLCFSPNRYWLCAATSPSVSPWPGQPTVRPSLPDTLTTRSGCGRSLPSPLENLLPRSPISKIFSLVWFLLGI